MTVDRFFIRTSAVFSLVAAFSISAGAAAPKMTIVVAVDQMRADYLQRFSREYIGGLARLNSEGAIFTQARHGHVPTETAPGHAALLTGCFPAQHGIVANDWWDRTTGKEIYSVDDTELGKSPKRELCPSLGDVLKAASPGSKVISISGKDRAAILMGGHKPDLVLWYETSTGEFASSAYYPSVPDWVKKWDAALGNPADQRKDLRRTPLFDVLTLALARRALEEENLGKHDAPDLLTVSLSATDVIGHQKGPDSLEMHNQLLALDRELGYFLDDLDQRFGRGNYTFALSADHGVLPSPESDAGKKMGAVRLNGASFLAAVETDLSKELGAPQKGKTWVVNVNLPNVYLNLPMAKELGVDAARVRHTAARILIRNPAVARVFSPDDLFGKDPAGDPLANMVRRSYHLERSGDLMVVLKESVLFSDDSPGYSTSHGTPYDYDARVPLVFMGLGIRSGQYDQPALAEDLAPTLGHILGLQFPVNSPSRVLNEALR